MKIADQISLGNTLEFVRPKASRLLRRKRAQMLQQSAAAAGANGYTARAMSGASLVEQKKFSHLGHGKSLCCIGEGFRVRWGIYESRWWLGGVCSSEFLMPSCAPDSSASKCVVAWMSSRCKSLVQRGVLAALLKCALQTPRPLSRQLRRAPACPLRPPQQVGPMGPRRPTRRGSSWSGTWPTLSLPMLPAWGTSPLPTGIRYCLVEYIHCFSSCWAS